MSKGQVQESQFETYGATGSVNDIKAFVLHCVQSNFEQRQKGRNATPVCIWGQKGISKTSIVEQLCKEQGWGFKCIPLGQTEEVGDITGMPARVVKMTKGDQWAQVTEASIPAYTANGWVIDHTCPAQSSNLAPAWVPIEGVDAPRGILLLDDFNRGPRNIQQAIMQVLQTYGLNSSWSIPVGWDIVLTANPTGGDYAVEELDDAQVTRMRHINMVDFDEKSWAAWAEKEEIDSRGINFVLAHPEVCSKGNRTCPRTLEQFFVLIKGIPSLKERIDFVAVCADSVLDKETTQMFLAFITRDMNHIISSEELLTGDSKTNVEKINRFLSGNSPRVDILNIMCTRLMNYLYLHVYSKKIELTAKMKNNLRDFFMIKDFPNDIRVTLVAELLNSEKVEGNKTLSSFVRGYKELVKIAIDEL